MNKNWKILFVDDDQRYADSLVDRAFEVGLDLEHYDNWEEAFSRLNDNFEEYHGVIIDGKGKLSKESKGDDQRHVNKAIGDLRELKGSKQPIPYVILSKYLDIKETIIESFFEKGKDEQQMFEHLINEIQNSVINNLKTRYKDVFAAFGEKYLNKEAELNLIEAIQSFENENASSNSYTPLRKLIEAVYKNLHEKDDKLIPYSCLMYENGKVNFTLCERRLKGQDINERTSGKIIHHKVPPVLLPHLGSLISEITKICSKSMHVDDPDYFTNYTYAVALFFIMDLMIWYKAFVDKYY